VTQELGETGGWPDIAGRMDGDCHVLPVRIYYEDTDFSGRVYHASYLRFCERGRTELLRATGLSHSELIGADGVPGGLFFAVHRMEVEFLAAAAIDDLLEVRSTFASASGARIVIAQEICRAGAPVVRAGVTVAILDGRGRPRRLPKVLAARFRSVPVRSNNGGNG
jgi:acyl-CoA thioester hydrolase